MRPRPSEGWGCEIVSRPDMSFSDLAFSDVVVVGGRRVTPAGRGVVARGVAARGVVAGVVAAAVWQATDPVLKRAFGTPYADAELLGPFITRGPLEPLADLVTHCAGGAAFGYLFARLGGRTVRHGVAAALAENTLLWPAMAIVDRVHPKVRNGSWPPLLRNRRAFAQATAGHAFFGVLLGALSRRRDD